MDKKDSKQLEKLFLIDLAKDGSYNSLAEIETKLKNRKADYSTISEERRNLNFEEVYGKTKPAFFYNKDKAKQLFDKVDFLDIVLPSTFDTILTFGIYNAHKSQDMSMLKNALHTKNRLKYGSLLFEHHSYNHSGQFEQLIYAFADCDIKLVKKYLPEIFGLADKNSHSFLRIGSNLIMSMLYKNETWLSESLALADKFNSQKSSSKNDILVIEYLKALSQQNMEKASVLLQEIADGYKKMAWLFNFKNEYLKFFGVYVHGLYQLAYFILPEEKFKEIAVPEHTVFWKEFDEYTKKEKFKTGELNLNLEGELDGVNVLFE